MAPIDKHYANINYTILLYCVYNATGTEMFSSTGNCMWAAVGLFVWCPLWCVVSGHHCYWAGWWRSTTGWVASCKSSVQNTKVRQQRAPCTHPTRERSLGKKKIGWEKRGSDGVNDVWIKNQVLIKHPGEGGSGSCLSAAAKLNPNSSLFNLRNAFWGGGGGDYD